MRRVMFVLALLAAGSIAPRDAAHAQERLVMAGSSSGGTSHLYFAAVATMINKYVPGVQASARSGGTAENVMLIERGELRVGVTEPGAAFLLQGPEWRQRTRLRTLYAMFTTPYHVIVPANSPVRTISDLKGRRVAVGTRQGGEAYLFQRVLESLGMRENEFRVEYLGKGEGINAYKDNVLDAMFYLCPLPCPVVTEVASHPRGARIIPLTEDEITKVRGRFGWYGDYTIERDVYANSLRNLSTDVRTITEWSYVVVRDDFPMELGYQIVRMLDEKYDELVAAFRPAATSTLANTARYPGFALHAATQRYLAEKGLRN